jgi:hypothetical protein
MTRPWLPRDAYAEDLHEIPLSDFGIATSGVVLSTLLQAADADYRLVVIQGLLRRPRPGIA